MELDMERITRSGCNEELSVELPPLNFQERQLMGGRIPTKGPGISVHSELDWNKVLFLFLLKRVIVAREGVQLLHLPSKAVALRSHAVASSFYGVRTSCPLLLESRYSSGCVPLQPTDSG